MSYTITGKNKLSLVANFLKNKKKKLSILDIGGTKHDLDFLNELGFNKVLVSNNSNNELKSCGRKAIKFDITKKALHKKFDIIIMMDVIEHLVEPDKSLININKMLSKKGIMIITTPNLANFFNRLFLLVGWSLPNYTPADIKTGNPLMRAKAGTSFRNSFSHKSVFTNKQLSELIELYGFKVIQNNGYHYGSQNANNSGGNFGSIRNVFNSILPTKMKEGIFIVAKKVKDSDYENLLKKVS